MLDREKIVALLTRRFPGSTAEQVAAAANAIVGLEDEWVEVSLPEQGRQKYCRDLLESGDDLRLFRRASRW